MQFIIENHKIYAPKMRPGNGLPKWISPHWTKYGFD